MYLDAAKKQEIFGQYGKSNTDTGSPEAQIALFSYRISHLTEHMKRNRKDHSTERALTTLVGKRRALLNYLKDRDIERYRAILKALNLRKYSRIAYGANELQAPASPHEMQGLAGFWHSPLPHIPPFFPIFTPTNHSRL